jgi:hypothetical protein
MSIATDTNTKEIYNLVRSAFVILGGADNKSAIDACTDVICQHVDNGLPLQDIGGLKGVLKDALKETLGVGNNSRFLDDLLDNIRALAGNAGDLTFERDLDAEAQVTFAIREIMASCVGNPEINTEELALMMDYRGVDARYIPAVTDALVQNGIKVDEPTPFISAANQYIGPDRSENKIFVSNSDAGNVLAAQYGLAPGMTLNLGSPA